MDEPLQVRIRKAAALARARPAPHASFPVNGPPEVDLHHHLAKLKLGVFLPNTDAQIRFTVARKLVSTTNRVARKNSLEA